MSSATLRVMPTELANLPSVAFFPAADLTFGAIVMTPDPLFVVIPTGSGAFLITGANLPHS